MRDEDSAVVQAVQAGDTEAFRLLVERHKGTLYGVILKLVNDPQVAEELAQDAFVKAFQALAGFRQEARFSTWLVQIGIHAARDHLRRKSRLRQQQVVSLEALREAQRHDLEPVDLQTAANPLAAMNAKEESDLMQAALCRLPAEYRELLVLKHLEGWPYERIATLSGDSVGTLKVRAHRARKLLKEKLASLGWHATGDSNPSDSKPLREQGDRP